MTFIASIKNKYSKDIKLIFLDRGGEYSNYYLVNFAKANRIRLDVSALYTLEQNRVAKSSNKTIITKARAIIINLGLLEEC